MLSFGTMLTVLQGKCSCYAGFSGAACDTPTARANECNSLVGVNLEGIADWAHSWTFVDIMKHGRAWISQVGSEAKCYSADASTNTCPAPTMLYNTSFSAGLAKELLVALHSNKVTTRLNGKQCVC